MKWPPYITGYILALINDPVFFNYNPLSQNLRSKIVECVAAPNNKEAKKSTQLPYFLYIFTMHSGIYPCS